MKYNEQEHILESIYDVDATDSIMPVGYYKNQMYFIHNKNDLTANETRSIAYFDGDKLVDLVDVKNALLTEAVIIEDKIYYVTYHQDISCDIIRIKDNKILKTVSEYDGYIIEDSTLTIYCEGTIHHFDL